MTPEKASIDGGPDPSRLGYLTFSGAGSAGGNDPTVIDKDGNAVAFGTATPLSFASTVATVASAKNGVLTLYKAETVDIAATNGTVSAAGADRLHVVVSAAAAARLKITGSGTQTAGTSQDLTITAYDAFGNVAMGYTGDKSLTFSGPARPGATTPR